MKAALIVLLALAGCASLTPERAAQLAANSPDHELCYVLASNKYGQTIKSAAYRELSSRRASCNDHATYVNAMIQQDIAANQQSNQAAWALLGAAQPKPSPAPTTRTCRSVVYGNQIQTVCD